MSEIYLWSSKLIAILHQCFEWIAFLLQGQWTPMTWQSTRMNVAELPDKEFSRHKSSKMSATEYVLQQARQKQENTPE